MTVADDIKTGLEQAVQATQSASTSPLKAIRQKCLDCVWDNPNEVRLCPAETCPLYPFRFGKNPYHKMNLSEEARAARAARARDLNRKRSEYVNET